MSYSYEDVENNNQNPNAFWTGSATAVDQFKFRDLFETEYYSIEPLYADVYLLTNSMYDYPLDTCCDKYIKQFLYWQNTRRVFYLT